MQTRSRSDIRGPAAVGRTTKQLLRRLRPGDIAVISHKDMDSLAASGLVRAGVRAVLNAEPSVSGRFPCSGPGVLLSSGIAVVDGLGPAILASVRDGQPLAVRGSGVLSDGVVVAGGRRLTPAVLERDQARAAENLDGEIEGFVDNTLEFARREKDLVLSDPDLPPLKTRFSRRHAVVVIRGRDFERDLDAIMGYIRHRRPVLVGVDGGADALLDRGLTPDVIIGDMDSAADRTLRSGAELVVHAYGDGSTPGMARLRSMGLPAHSWAVRGTSEDAALLLAHASGADLIVAVGTHSNVLDFLEKGRPGMASTFLVRLRVGAKLVDARGVGEIYRYGPGPRHWIALAAAGLLPAAVLIASSPLLMGWVRLLSLRFKLLMGW